ncbi:MAG: hypothetical protein K1Y36_28280, partial [Blastocatellia bacterium]|nr:hypothetical protein [Blastocatellia bacterium]
AFMAVSPFLWLVAAAVSHFTFRFVDSFASFLYTLSSRTGRKIQDISLRIRDLLRMKETLQEIAGQCDGHGGTAECPILHALEGPVSCHPNHNPKRSKNL